MNFTKGNSVNSLTDKSNTFAIYNLIQLILITIKLLNYQIVKEREAIIESLLCII